METEAKYYTPEIEEFRVGFEFKYLNHFGENFGNKWATEIVDTGGSFFHIESLLASNCVRVKYLDSEDIESLGFIFNAGVTERTDRFSYKNFMLWFNREAKIVRIAEMNKQIVFQRAFPMGVELDYKELFNGTVKNKSELKQVLKMIGVQ